MYGSPLADGGRAPTGVLALPRPAEYEWSVGHGWIYGRV